MRLKRLELQGFKSFLDRTILTFDPGITGVVGPNGCGKSNIVDAIQWVMGEQSAKHLRGEAMTDVIFNGSDNRAPTSMAEVSLILDRQGIPLSPQFAIFDKGDEISVTRRVYRDGTGEFFINKSPCRLKDIHELFMDTGVGRRAYSIIEQGQIDRMINVKPDERRSLFEEVAGITKYKVKRKEAERKLELTRQNLLRLHDIVTELEKQIRSLKVQATRARKYKELKGEMEIVDLHLLGRSLFTHKKAIDELQARANELITARSESDALFSQMDAEVTSLEILRIEQEQGFQALSQKERDLSLLIQKLESQLALFDERRGHLAHSQEESIREEEEIHTNLASLQEESESSLQERDDLGQSLHDLDLQISQGELKLRQHHELKQRASHKKESLADQKNGLAQKAISLQNQQQHGQARESEILETIEGLAAKLVEITATIELSRQSLREADQKIEECSARNQRTAQEATVLNAECQATSAKLSQMEDALFKSRETFHSKRSRLQSLTELQENLEGYSPSAREILLQLEGTGTAAVPLAEVLQPDASIEEHLEMLLGVDMNTLLVPTTTEAETLARLIQERGLERVRVLAISEITVEMTSLSESGIAGSVPLLSKTRVKPGYEAAARWWLGNAFLCDTMDAVFQLRTQFPQATLLTPDSRTISHDDHSISSGKLPTKMGVFARRREIEELTEVCRGLEEELATLATAREKALQDLKEQEALSEQLRDKLSSIHIESVEHRKERESRQLELGHSERDHENVSRDVERNRSQIDGLRVQLVKWVSELESLAGEQERLVAELQATDAEIEEMAREFESLGTTINEAKVERSRLGEKLNGIEYKIAKIKSDVAQLDMRRESVLNQRERDQAEILKIEQSSVDVRSERQDRETEKNAALVRISDTKEAFNETCTKLQDLRERKNELQKRRESVLAEIQEIELKIAREQSSFDQVRGISIERYQQEAVALDDTAQIDIEKLPIFTSQLETDWLFLSELERQMLLQEHLKGMREKVTRYGEVNLTAIHEFDEVQKRYDFLIVQRTDLEKSISILEEAIQKIDESTKVRFFETFEAVNKKFQEIFPILFNGGKAELALTDSANVLEAGVDIMVHPPGKKPASITLLSGGEKALTAVSLILAIFARKPSPFCLLDEVDAPLDDANVSRFNTVVRKMAEKTQFIVITHNKKTMEIAEALYGVTMEKPGISKMASVRLS